MFIRFFQKKYPDIALDLSQYTAATRQEMVFSMDILLSMSDYTNSLSKECEGTFLMIQEPLLAIPPYHRLGDMQETTMEGLKNENLLVPYPEEIIGPYARNAMAAGRKYHGMTRRINVENTYTALLMVELGAGVMLIPHHLKHRVYPSTRTITVADPDCTFPVYGYLSRSPNNSAAELFFQEILLAFLEN